MTKDAIIQKTLEVLSLLPEDKVQEVSDFADYILNKYDDKALQQGIHSLVENSDSFSFLREEEEIYSLSDLKEKY